MAGGRHEQISRESRIDDESKLTYNFVTLERNR
jgi:hypothetical protein